MRKLEERVRELERLLGRKTMEVEILREALSKANSKKPIWRLLSLPKGGFPMKRIAEAIGVSRSNLVQRTQGKSAVITKHRIAVTGASGFVGKWVTRRLEELGGSLPIDVFPLPSGAENNRQFDITDSHAVERAVAEARPTALIHLAAVAFPAEVRLHPRRAWDVNVTGTWNLANAILQHAPDAWLIFAGSSEAYGMSLNECPEPVSESVALKPITPYGATKAAADLLLGQMAHDGLNVIRFRPFNHTGPGQSAMYVVSAFARQIARVEVGLQKPLIEVGNLDAERDFLDVRDVVEAYVTAAIGFRGAPGEHVYNLATSRPCRVGAILEWLLAASTSSIDVRVDPARVRPLDTPRASGDSSRAAAVLGWLPTIPLEKTFSDVLDYWRQLQATAREPATL